MSKVARWTGAALCALALLLGVSEARAQTTNGMIQGRIVTADGDAPLASANAVLRPVGQDQAVAVATSNGTGRFRMMNLPAGRYTLEISYIGYATHRREVTVTAGQLEDIGTIRLSIEAIVLDAVTVESERPQAVYAPDRDIYTTDALPAADGGVATELMASIPDVEVDFDGSVTLQGSAPQIYLNGRPAPMDGEALAAFLEQFPADRIERVEVIPNPSARFSAEGSGGIINIVLKEGVDLGASGSVFTNIDTRGATGVGGQGTYQRGRLTLSGGGSVRTSNQETTGYDFRQNLRDEPNTFLRQDNWSDQSRLSGNARLTAELQVGERGLLRARTNLSGHGSDSESAMMTTRMNHLEVPTQQYERFTDQASDRRSYDLRLGYTHSWEPQRHTLDVEFEVNGGSNRSDREVHTRFDLLDEIDGLLPADRMIDDTDNVNDRFSMRVDYVRPLGDETQLEAGYRGQFQTRDNMREIEQFEFTPEGEIATTSVRGYLHEEDSHSGYLTLARRFGNLGIQLGTRVRWMDMHFEVPTGEGFETSDFDFFPTANVTYDFENGRRVRLSYSRRTRRPPASRLNPIDQSTDPLNRDIGNPDLEPQYTHSFGLDLNASTSWGNLRLSPYYRRITNDWARIQRVDEDGVSTRSWENLASQENYGASLTASIRGQRGWGGFVSLSGRGERRDPGNLSTTIRTNSFHWSIRGNISGQIIGGLGVRANLSYTPARDVAQGRMGSRVDSSIGLRQRFMDGRLSVSLTANDPFDISRTTFESRDPTFIQLGRSEVSRQSVRLSASYTFGEAGHRGGGRGRR